MASTFIQITPPTGNPSTVAANPMMGLELSREGMLSTSFRMLINTQNIANAGTQGKAAYCRKLPVASLRKVGPFTIYTADHTVADSAPFPSIHAPSHQDADSEGMLRKSNVDLMQEGLESMDIATHTHLMQSLFTSFIQKIQKILELPEKAAGGPM